MDKEESWQQFWGSGKVEDYLSYSMWERESGYSKYNEAVGTGKERHGTNPEHAAQEAINETGTEKFPIEKMN